jgi:hypothetical protein
LEDLMADATTETKPILHYALHSVVRKTAFRTHRAMAAAHVRKKQFVGDTQMRLVPARRLLIGEDVLLRNLAEIRQKAADHILEVRTLDGRLVDLSTLQPGPAAPTPLLPHPKLDSVADDKPTGQYIPPYVGDDHAMPHVLQPGEKPSLLREAEREIGLDAAASEAATDADLEAAVAAAQEAASAESPPPAPLPRDEVSSKKAAPRRGDRRNQR